MNYSDKQYKTNLVALGRYMIDGGHVVKCQICGRESVVSAISADSVCTHCNSHIVRFISGDSEENADFEKAEELLNSGNFNMASELYKKQVKSNKSCLMGYWGIVCAEYGVKFNLALDNTDNMFYPECSKFPDKSVFTSENATKILSISKSLGIENDFMLRLQQIDDAVMIKSYKIVDTENYDVYINVTSSYMYNGFMRPTPDSSIATNIYRMLKELGFKVYSDNEGLRGKSASDYAIIKHRAVNSSKVMIVIASDKNFLNCDCMIEPMTDYAKYMRINKSRLIIPIYIQSENMHESDYETFGRHLEMNVINGEDVDFYNLTICRVKEFIERTNNKLQPSIKTKTITKSTHCNEIDFYNQKVENIATAMDRVDIVKLLADNANAIELRTKYNPEVMALIIKNPYDHSNLKQLLFDKESVDNLNDYFTCITQNGTLDYLEQFLSIASSEDLKTYLNEFKNKFLRLVIDENITYEVKIKSFLVLISYLDAKEVSTLSKLLFSLALNVAPDNAVLSCLEMANKLLPSSCVDEWVIRHIRLVGTLRSRGNFSLASTVAGIVLKHNSNHPLAKFSLYLAINEVDGLSTGSALSVLDGADVASDLEEFIAQGVDVNPLMSMLIAELRIKLKKANREEVLEVEETFNEFSALLSNIYQDNELIRIFVNAAELLLQKKEFNLADKYFRQVLSIDGLNSRAMLGLLKVQIKVSNDLELLLTQEVENEWAESEDYYKISKSLSKEEEISFKYFKTVNQSFKDESGNALKNAVKYCSEAAASSNVKCPNIAFEAESAMIEIIHKYDEVELYEGKKKFIDRFYKDKNKYNVFKTILILLTPICAVIALLHFFMINTLTASQVSIVMLTMLAIPAVSSVFVSSLALLFIGRGIISRPSPISGLEKEIKRFASDTTRIIWHVVNYIVVVLSVIVCLLIVILAM